MSEITNESLTIERGACLQPFNTMAVAATANALVKVANIAQLSAALEWAEQHDLSVLVLGEGSNTIFKSDYSGLVILNEIKGIEILDDSYDSVLIEVGAGESWHKLVEHTVEHAWHGLENLALIPGLVGAAPIQNIGAYGVDVSHSLRTVEYVDIDSKTQHSLTNKQCQFAYRDSIFKLSLRDKTVITAVTFELSKKANLNLSYPALRSYLDQINIQSPSLKDVFRAICAIRKRKLPSPKDIPNAGSFFKNPLVSAAELAKLKQRFPELVSFKVNGGYKLAAAWLIENAGWKQREIDGVRVHQEQALVLINPNRLNGQAIVNLAQCIQSDIRVRYEVVLDIEPRLI